MTDKPLAGKIALVTGASRGAGRGIALELGAAGATVYVTGRSTSEGRTNNFPGTVEETAEAVSAAGGAGIPVRCDHRRDEETQALVERIRREQGRLDLLVNNVWGGHDLPFDLEVKPMWEWSLAHWDTMFNGGVRAQLATNFFAIPLMRESGPGLIVHTTFWDDDRYTGTFFYDLAKNALVRMAFGLATELKRDGITAVAVTPGWMRTELVLAHHGADESNWQDVPELAQTESPRYLGRAVCALAADPSVMEKSGRVLRVADLAREYGFTDIDGRQPPAFRALDVWG